MSHTAPTWILRCHVCGGYTEGRGQMPHTTAPFICGNCTVPVVTGRL